MSLRFLISVFAAAQTIGGIACVAAPSMMLGSFEVALPAMGLVVYQFWGASMAAVGVLCWLLRDRWDSRDSLPVWAALAGLNAANAALAVKGQVVGAGASGWAMVVLYTFFTLVFLVVAIRSMRQEKPHP